jgi:hypothetical protein
MNDQRIIYASDDGGVAVIIPALGCGIPLFEIGRKDVPPIVTYEGTGEFITDEQTEEQREIMQKVETPRPFRIIPASAIPTDRTYREAWTADFSAPDGHGIGADAWFAEQASANAAGG